MAQFTKTVSQLSRAELLAVADNFELANTGTVTTLRKRIKSHIDDNEHYMDHPRYAPLFSPQQRARHAARSVSPTPPPWGGIGAETPIPDNLSADENPGNPAGYNKIGRHKYFQVRHIYLM